MPPKKGSEVPENWSLDLERLFNGGKNDAKWSAITQRVGAVDNLTDKV